jgi:aryl-alcohol dehydrogenase-like predicted oxidoreductase
MIMRTTTLGKSGPTIGAVGLGCMSMFVANVSSGHKRR